MIRALVFYSQLNRGTYSKNANLYPNFCFILRKVKTQQVVMIVEYVECSKNIKLQ